MSVNYSFNLGFGFKLTEDNFQKRHIGRKTHTEPRFNEKTGEKYNIVIEDSRGYDEYLFNGKWESFSPFYEDEEMGMPFEKVLGETANIHWSFDCTGNEDNCCFITVESAKTITVDEGRIDVSWDELTIEDLIPTSEQLNLFKKKLEQYGCINLDKAVNKFSCCSRIG